MKKNSTKSLKWLTGAVIVLGLIALGPITCQTFGFFYGYPVQQKAEWIEGLKGLQVSIIILRMIGGLAFSALLTMFIYYTAKGAKAGILFPKQNFGILIGSAISLFVYRFFYDNTDLLSLANDHTRAICVSTDSLLFALIIVAFAMMYRIASKVSEENSLTI